MSLFAGQGVSRPSLQHLSVAAAAGFGLHELRASGPLRVQLLPSGAVFALRHHGTLLNQLLPSPAEDGLFRLLVRWTGADGVQGWAPLVGAGLGFGIVGQAAASWSTAAGALRGVTVLQLHPTHAAWAWHVRLLNTGATPLRADLLLAQDLGLGDEGFVRNNEAYASHYLDLLPVRDDTLGWTILARQNLPMAHGRHPWLAMACADGAAEFCTDGTQFFGADHRLAGTPAAVRAPRLPSQRLQYEFALAGLQSRTLDLAPGAVAEVTFIARYLEDHAIASSTADLPLLRELCPLNWITDRSPPASPARAPAPPSLFVTAPWLHGEAPVAADWDRWFPGPRRHEERAADGRVLAFFHGPDTHVVARDKEAAIARPHGHILRSGDARWFDAGQFGVTCGAAGVFGAQAYLGHPSFARLLSVVRNALNVARASGQRVFVRHDGAWRQLGVPSAFAMTPGDVRWIYRVGERRIEARVWCAREQPAAFLELRVTSGPPGEFLITHQLVVGAAEFEHPVKLAFDPEAGWVSCMPSPETMIGRHQRGTCFAIAAADVAHVEALGGDGLLFADGVERGGPYVTLRTPAGAHCGVILLGTHDGPDALAGAVAAARAEFAAARPAGPPAPPVRLGGATDVGVAKIDEVLPWFTHNAAIHFAAPHGLEQYGGAAWGVRDVCQGSVEWLLAAGEFATVRRILETVFAQQYAPGGHWPQWFMFPPFRSFQQAHSHGDVCFWPVKALCDYVEASGDLALLRARVDYLDPQRFEPARCVESMLEHCDRVIAHVETRFLAGTALVNYGDGDWDDTLQPADPAMRTRMVSSWTVALAFQTFGQLAALCRRAGEEARAARLESLSARMRGDFSARLMPNGVVAGFLVTEPDGTARPLLHPRDAVTRIRYRLLPMTRAIIAELFTPDEARRHLDLIESELRFPDGVRLMSEPAIYQGGVERLFKRADSAANVGREIGLHYVHAHLRYAEALAKVGDAERLWIALQLVNPVGLAALVPHAAPRQSNVYFSSSDADFPDRYEAAARWSELRTGRVAVRAGWRLYSSGPGLFLRQVRASLLGVRETFGDVVFDPVLPRCLDGLVATVRLRGRPVRISYRVSQSTHGPSAITVNGVRLTAIRDANPYRTGGLRVAGSQLAAVLAASENRIEVEL